MIPGQNPKSVLLITLDSCRFDTFAAAHCPNLKSVGQLHKAMAPGNFTYPSHSAIFVGFTPGVAESTDAFSNPKIGRIFRLAVGNIPAKGTEHFIVDGRNIIEGFRRAGFATIGTAGVRWLDPHTPSGSNLTGHFEKYRFFGYHGLARQAAWAGELLAKEERPVFLFINVGETHVPYWYEGASWSREDNPCKSYPHHAGNNAQTCARRQRECLEFADRQLAPIVTAFAKSNTVICADHGDVWGEDGLWEHSFHHPKVMEVPLLYRLAESVKIAQKPPTLPPPGSFLKPQVIVAGRKPAPTPVV